MKKTILITGATDGIGLEAVKLFVKQGHDVWVHGRSRNKLELTIKQLNELSLESTLPSSEGDNAIVRSQITPLIADLSDLKSVIQFAEQLKTDLPPIDVLINNAGVFKVQNPTTLDQLDVRFAVNTIAPYIITQAVLFKMDKHSRVINLSSAAQAPVSLGALTLRGQHGRHLEAQEAYAQSKLALTMWTFFLASKMKERGPVFVALNPASLLASKMVKDAYGIIGKDISIGAEVIVEAALGEDFADANGRYYDNDIGQFADPHSDALNDNKVGELVNKIEQIITEISMANENELSA